MNNPMNPMQMLGALMGGQGNTGGNPMMMLLQLLNASSQGGGNPMQILQMLARQSPQVNRGLNLARGKNNQQLRAFVENMARQQGTTVEELAKQYGFTLPPK